MRVPLGERAGTIRIDKNHFVMAYRFANRSTAVGPPSNGWTDEAEALGESVIRGHIVGGCRGRLDRPPPHQ